MPQIIDRKLCIILLFIALLWGCSGSSSSNSGEDFVSETGHPENWVNYSYLGTDDFHGSSVDITYGGPKGPALFAMRCAGCHGSDATGKIGPNIQGRTSSQIKNSINSVKYMQWLGKLLTDNDIESVADYLKNTSTTTTYTVNAGTCAECHGEDFNGGISKIGCYSCHNGTDGTVGHPSGWTSQKSNSMRFHGYYSKKFQDSCKACHGTDLRGPAVASCYSCHGTCSEDNCPPVANAGADQTVAVGSLVTLDGTGSSDVNGDALTYNWSFSSRPTGSSATLSNSVSSRPTFTADAAGTYVINLVVSDGKSNSETDSVTITTSSTSLVSYSGSVQLIFNNNCTTTCHSSGGTASFLPLTSGVSYNNLINQPSTRTGTPPSGTLVIPYDSANSVLYQRISGVGLPSGENTMPPPSTGNTLSSSDQNTIKNWIDQGAQNN
jgi:mono/diheme cytochrome c family protein